MGRAALIRGLAVLAVLMAAPSGCTSAPSRPDWSRDPIAVALSQDAGGSHLIVIDLRKFEVVRRVRLRSLCLSIDGDNESRTVVTAQCGGPDRAADNAAGIWRPAQDKQVRYVPLDVPNPTSVAARDGRALLVHGFEQPEGVCASTVDLRTRRLVQRGHLPPMALRPETASAAVWIPVAACADASGAVCEVVDTSCGETVAALSAESATVVADSSSGPGASAWIVHRTSRLGHDWSLTRFVQQGRGPDRAASPSVRVSGVRKGIYEACKAGDTIALADADALDLSDPGRDVLLVDARSLRQTGRIRVKGTPSALRSWGETLLVLDGLRGELLLFEPGETTPRRTVSLGGSSLGTGDLTVFDSPVQNGK